MMSSVSLSYIADCGYELGGDARAPKFYSQRELALFAAESRWAISLSGATERTHHQIIELNDSEDEDASIVILD